MFIAKNINARNSGYHICTDVTILRNNYALKLTFFFGVSKKLKYLLSYSPWLDYRTKIFLVSVKIYIQQQTKQCFIDIQSKYILKLRHFIIVFINYNI